jgi:hypothetical protein
MSLGRIQEVGVSVSASPREAHAGVCEGGGAGAQPVSPSPLRGLVSRQAGAAAGESARMGMDSFTY